MAYDPQLPPTSLGSLGSWAFRELNRLASELQESRAVNLRPLSAEPDKPADGMIIYADGTNFDPGSGEGIYARVSHAWVKLHV